MPCSDGRDSGEYDRAEARQARAEVQAAMQVLCYVCTRYERGDSFADAIQGNPTLEKWWEVHKAEDAERLKREEQAEEHRQAKRAALAKLTPQERAVLGFNEAI